MDCLEAFGQTLLIASGIGLPEVMYHVGSGRRVTPFSTQKGDQMEGVERSGASVVALDT